MYVAKSQFLLVESLCCFAKSQSPFLWVEFQFLSVEAPVFNICHVQSSSLLLLNPHFCRLNHPCSGIYSPFLQVKSPFLLVESPFFMVQCRPDPCQRRSVRNHFGAPLRRWFATNSLQQWWGRCTASSWRGTSRADTWADLITSIDLMRFYFNWLSNFDNDWSLIWYMNKDKIDLIYSFDSFSILCMYLSHYLCIFSWGAKLYNPISDGKNAGWLIFASVSLGRPESVLMLGHVRMQCGDPWRYKLVYNPIKPCL